MIHTPSEADTRYREAQDFEGFVWLPDAQVLALRLDKERERVYYLLWLRGDGPTLVRINSRYKYELGRYIVRRKIGKHAEFTLIDEAEIKGNWHDILEVGERAVKVLPEPFKSRLSAFLFSLSSG